MIGIISGCRKQREYERWLVENGLSYRIVSSVEDLGEISPTSKAITVAIFCGGPDLGENPERDELDRMLFEACLERHIPVFGGCRGMQEISYFLQDADMVRRCGLGVVVVGSPLIEDLDERNAIHRTQADDSSRFHDIFLSDGHIWRVNSRHHQAVLRPPFNCSLTAQWIPSVADKISGTGATCPVWELFVSVDGQFFLTQCHPELKEMRGTEMSRASIDWLKSKLTTRT